jgi:hypothetical protein
MFAVGSMVHTLLSLMLVATQVLSGNSAALYVCLEPDGSFCLDFGPSTCGCCQHDETDGSEAEHDACGDHDCDHHPADVASSDEHAEPDCPCDHVQISEPQTATVHKAAAPPQDHLPPAPLAIVSDLAAACFSTNVGESLSARLHDGPSLILAERASVVLRC